MQFRKPLPGSPQADVDRVLHALRNLGFNMPLQYAALTYARVATGDAFEAIQQRVPIWAAADSATTSHFIGPELATAAVPTAAHGGMDAKKKARAERFGNAANSRKAAANSWKVERQLQQAQQEKPEKTQSQQTKKRKKKGRNKRAGSPMEVERSDVQPPKLAATIRKGGGRGGGRGGKGGGKGGGRGGGRGGKGGGKGGGRGARPSVSPVGTSAQPKWARKSWPACRNGDACGRQGCSFAHPRDKWT